MLWPTFNRTDGRCRITAHAAGSSQCHAPYVRKASHVGRYGWITATITDEESLENGLEWLRESYWLKAPATLRDAAFR